MSNTNVAVRIIFYLKFCFHHVRVSQSAEYWIYLLKKVSLWPSFIYFCNLRRRIKSQLMFCCPYEDYIHFKQAAVVASFIYERKNNENIFKKLCKKIHTHFDLACRNNEKLIASFIHAATFSSVQHSIAFAMSIFIISSE